MNKIAIVGSPLVGKSTVAKHICDTYDFEELRFADGIYRIARMFGFRRKRRWLLQLIGQTGRKIHPKLWIKLTERKMKQLEKQGKNVLISDTRQINEYKWLKEHGFKIIVIASDFDKRLERAIKRDREYPKVSRWFKQSEVAAENYAKRIERVIENNGTEDELKQKVNNWIVEERSQYEEKLTQFVSHLKQVLVGGGTH